jgi:N-carbamoylputrescine amidase
VQKFDRTDEGVLVHEFDLDFLDRHRAAWGFFRDRRTEFYK